jgi:ribosome biogenesis GTPase A
LPKPRATPARPEKPKRAKQSSAKPSQVKQPSTAFQRVQELLKWVDLVIEVCDARAPDSSRHPGAEKLFGNKPRILVLAKNDLAEPKTTGSFIEAFGQSPHRKAIALSLKVQQGKGKLIQIALDLTADKRKALENKGILPRPARICVVGLPNVGKSTLINWLLGKKKVKVGDKPGITRGTQWVRVHPQIELLDTPGILPATEFTPDVVIKLAMLNLLTQTSYQPEDVARPGLSILSRLYPQKLRTYVGAVGDENISLETIALHRNLLATGATLDTLRAANVFLADLRSGKLGAISLDGQLTDE